MQDTQREQLLPRTALAFNDAEAEIEDTIRCIAERGRWRPRLVSSIGLLRTMGDILRKVEAKQSEAHRACIIPWWDRLRDTKPEPRIWWDFIDKDRSLILHEYAFRVERRFPRLLASSTGVPMVAASGRMFLASADLFTVTEGHFKGRDGRHLLREALQWWRVQLCDLETCIRSKLITDNPA